MILKSKIKQMREHEAEGEFYRIKGLFTKNINGAVIVQIFQEEYDSEFQFEGTPLNLYKRIGKWIKENIND